MKSVFGSAPESRGLGEISQGGYIVVIACAMTGILLINIWSLFVVIILLDHDLGSMPNKVDDWARACGCHAAELTLTTGGIGSMKDG